MPQLVIHLRWRCHRAGHFGAQHLAVTFAQSANVGTQGGKREPEPRGGRRLVRQSPRAGHEHLELIVEPLFSFRREVGAQPLQGAAHERSGPALLKLRVFLAGSAGRICFFQMCSRFRFSHHAFEREKFVSAAAFHGAAAFVRFREEVLERREEKGAKPPARRVYLSERFCFEQVDEEVLRQILRICGV